MRFSCLPLLAAFHVIYPGLISAYDTDYVANAHSKQSGQVKGYYPSYNSIGGQTPADINYALYTDLIFFAVIPQANNTIAFDPAFTADQGPALARQFVAECKKHNVNPLVSLGGYSGSLAFSNLTLTSSSRKAFAKEIVRFAQSYGFTGLEMDWEYPNSPGVGCNSYHPRDTVHFGMLVKEIRDLWSDVSITAAISINGLIGSSGGVANITETKLLVKYLDYINLMAYDVVGNWYPYTGPVAPLYNKCATPEASQSVETGLQVVLQQGFRPEQIVLGIPGYGKRSQLLSPILVPKTVNGTTTYMWQNHTSVTPQGGKFDDKPGTDVCGAKTTWSGSFLVKELISEGWLSADEKTGLNGYKRYFDECSGTPFLTNGKYFIAYDDTQSTVLKAKYAKSQHLRGIYFFDTQGPTDATISAARHVVMDD